MFNFADIAALGEKAAQFMAIISKRVDALEEIITGIHRIAVRIEQMQHDAAKDRAEARRDSESLKLLLTGLSPEMADLFKAGGESEGPTAAQVFASIGLPLPENGEQGFIESGEPRKILAGLTLMSSADEADLADAERLTKEQQKPTELATAIVTDFDKAQEA